MLTKLKRFLKKYKGLIKIAIFLLILMFICILLYKTFFYSDNEDAIYGVRLRNISEYKIKKDEIKNIEKNISEISGVKDIDINIKGRLIKIFITIEDGKSKDEIKTIMNSILSNFSEDIKGYYDITFYAQQNIDGKIKYPVIGYKHKNKVEISFDEI